MKNAWTIRGLLAAMAVALLMVTAPVPALAHAKLLHSVPEADSVTHPSPTELRLTFSERVELAFTKVTLIGPNGEEVELEVRSLDPEDEKTLVIPLDAPLADGDHTVAWSAVSADGHKMSGSYSIVIAQ